MEEIDEGAAPEETTLAGTPNVAPAGDDGGAYGQPEVQYAKRSVAVSYTHLTLPTTPY